MVVHELRPDFEPVSVKNIVFARYPFLDYLFISEDNEKDLIHRLLLKEQDHVEVAKPDKVAEMQ